MQFHSGLFLIFIANLKYHLIVNDFMLLNKKGDVSPVFKYIFVMIVGAMFLLFFVNFAFKYIGTQEKKESLISISGFDDTLSILGTSDNAKNVYNFEREVSYTFEDGKIGTLNSSKSTSKNVFSPRMLNGRKIVIWTRKWIMPYAIDSFFYMTNEKHRYYIVYQPEFEELAKDLDDPQGTIYKDLQLEVKSASIISNSMEIIKTATAGSTRVKFLMLGNDNNLEAKLKRIKNAEVIVAIPENQNSLIGNIEFEDETTMYLGEAMLFGALFAENSESYDFAVERSLEKMELITKIYSEKSSMMASKLPSCGYNLFKTNLDSLQVKAKERKKEASDYVTVMNALTESNKNFPANCPEVF